MGASDASPESVATARMPEGLSSRDAADRLVRFGPNELPSSDRRDFARIVRETLSEPLLLLLLVASSLYFLIGDLREAVMLLTMGIVNVLLVVYQEHKTERTLEALRDLSSPRALVIRNGERIRIPGRDVVPDDLLVLAEGDRVAADGVLVSSANLAADESLLTGESAPVRKLAALGVPAMGRPGGDDLPWVFSGSLIVSGHGLVRVTRTGGETEVGHIGRSLAGLEPEKTRLRRVTARLTRYVAFAGLGVSLIVTLLHGWRSGAWIDATLAGITIAMSMLPEEIPVVLTVFLTLGAWRISRRNVLARRAAAIETLGAATVLCTDKTGTLTLNRMSVVCLWTPSQVAYLENGASAVPLPLHDIVRLGSLACARHPSDPMELAFQRLAETIHWQNDATLAHEYGLTKELLAVAYVWRNADDTLNVAAKGAPEAIADLCGLHDAERAAVLNQVAAMAGQGLRVLGVAQAQPGQGRLPDTPRGFAFRFVGLVGLEDPVRSTVPSAVADCRRAGIHVVMITGDYPVTALAIARQAGIDTAGGVVTGPELAAMSDGELRRRLASVRVFARILPEQKLRIVNALKAGRSIVAMTGDGVNDAPALKTAHIGIAMGGRGTDVAREAAGLVLLDDAFESIVAAIRLGRRILDNLRKALSYIFAIHVPIAGLAILPLLIGWPIIFFPIHILFLEFVIDPICSIVFEAEPEGEDIMDRPPRDPEAPLFGLHEVTFGILQGLVGLAACVSTFMFTLHGGAPDSAARAAAFITLVGINVVLVLSNRSWSKPAYQTVLRHNAVLWWVLAVAAGVLGIALFVPVVSALFRFSLPSPESLAVAGMATVVAFGLVEGLKVIRHATQSPLPGPEGTG